MQDSESVQDSRNGRDKQIVTILEEGQQRQMGNCLQTPDVVNQKNTNIMLEITGKPLIVKKKMSSDFCTHTKKAEAYV